MHNTKRVVAFPLQQWLCERFTMLRYIYYITCVVGIMFQNLALKKGSDLRKLWSKIPDGIDFKIYMFNITNPMDVQAGKKPIVTEIGPYFFE